MSEERRFGHHDYKRVRRAHANLAGLDQQQCEAVLSLLLTERDAAREEMVRLRRGDLTRAEIEELLETDPERVGKGMAVQLRLPQLRETFTRLKAERDALRIQLAMTEGELVCKITERDALRAERDALRRVIEGR